MRPPATRAEGANPNDNKVKSLAAVSVCFPVPAKGALARAPHSRCFGNLKLSIRHRLCWGPISKQQEMLSLAVTNDCQWWFWRRKSSFQIYPTLQGMESRRAARAACGAVNLVMPPGWARTWEHPQSPVGGRIWLGAHSVTSFLISQGQPPGAALPWPSCSSVITESLQSGVLLVWLVLPSTALLCIPSAEGVMDSLL